jgi:septal ring-binding cell division protein DamX
MATEDSDITIGPAKLLGLFFMLVAICGVFFAIGYSLGKTSAREQAMNDKTPLSASLSAPIVGDSGAAKPSAAVPAKSEAEPATTPQQPKQEEPDLTFFNSVKRSDRGKPDTTATATQSKPVPTKADEQTSAKALAPVQTTAPAPITEVSAPAKTPAKTDTKAVVTPSASGAFVVQIAAVTREEDAAALAGALRRKNYSVFVVNNPAVHDKFYHVQVGPFATMQDAEATKVKLTGEGYNPIVKRS